MNAIILLQYAEEVTQPQLLFGNEYCVCSTSIFGGSLGLDVSMCCHIISLVKEVVYMSTPIDRECPL
jgi:hypothetical protein